MIARLLYPKNNINGNLLWKKAKFSDKTDSILISLDRIRALGYWASPFPEGDGVTFSVNEGVAKSNVDILNDFKSSFDWISIDSAMLGNSNIVLAELECDDTALKCIVIVPLDKIFIQKTISIGIYKFFCRVEFDEEPHERLAQFTCEYLQFETKLNYKDLLKLNRTIKHNDIVINKCLSLAECALDIVSFCHSSFARKEFTPNPAGQMGDGFFSVEIIPIDESNLESFELSGISRPLSVGNNWLGPQVDNLYHPAIGYLARTYSAELVSEMALAVKTALRSCRQSFYSLGAESQLLNLIFTLDGLAEPESNWRGWQHRTYIAALLSNSSHSKFEGVLESYDIIYTEVRNKLVHEGKDFYQIGYNPDELCEETYCYIKDLITLIAIKNFNYKRELKDYAKNLLKSSGYVSAYTRVITRVSNARGKKIQLPNW